MYYGKNGETLSYQFNLCWILRSVLQWVTLLSPNAILLFRSLSSNFFDLWSLWGCPVWDNCSSHPPLILKHLNFDVACYSQYYCEIPSVSLSHWMPVCPPSLPLSDENLLKALQLPLLKISRLVLTSFNGWAMISWGSIPCCWSLSFSHLLNCFMDKCTWKLYSWLADTSLWLPGIGAQTHLITPVFKSARTLG